jgi:AraC-like DNA-binding protein
MARQQYKQRQRPCAASTRLPTGQSGGLAPWQLRRAMDFIRANLSGNISLEQLASVCDLSVNYFARAFKECTGVLPHRWLVEMRLEKAKDLPLNTKMPLAEVAVACGFADQSHFSKTFVRATGNTPGAWRASEASARLSFGGPKCPRFLHHVTFIGSSAEQLKAFGPGGSNRPTIADPRSSRYRKRLFHHIINRRRPMFLRLQTSRSSPNPEDTAVDRMIGSICRGC